MTLQWFVGDAPASPTPQKTSRLKGLEGGGEDGTLLQQMGHGRGMLWQGSPELYEVLPFTVAVDGVPSPDPADVVEIPGDREDENKQKIVASGEFGGLMQGFISKRIFYSYS